MIIPNAHSFECRANPSDKLTVNISKSEPESVLFELNGLSVFIEDPEQITLIRDMLTVWLSRQKK